MGIIGSFEGYVTSPLYLYNKGVWSGLQTIGTTKTYSYYSDSNCDSTPYYNGISNYMGVGVKGAYSSAGNGNVLIRTNQTINLTNYTFIKCDIYSLYARRATSNGYVGASTSSSLTSLSFSASGSMTASSSTSSDSKNGNIICNISSLTGNYYIYLALEFSRNTTYSGNDGEFYVSNIYLTNS